MPRLLPLCLVAVLGCPAAAPPAPPTPPPPGCEAEASSLRQRATERRCGTDADCDLLTVTGLFCHAPVSASSAGDLRRDAQAWLERCRNTLSREARQADCMAGFRAACVEGACQSVADPNARY